MRSLLLVVAIAVAAASPAGAASLRYALTLAGVPLGALTLDSEEADGSYRANVGFRTAGFAGLLDYGLDGTAIGRQDADHGLVPALFTGSSRSPRALRYTRIEWKEGALAFVAVEPPRSETVDASAAAGALDPASALLRVVLPGSPEGVCGASLDVFDGSRAIRLQLGAPTEVAGTIVCDGVYTRLGGEPLTPIDPPECPFQLRYHHTQDGAATLDEIRIPTRFGEAMIERAA